MKQLAGVNIVIQADRHEIGLKTPSCVHTEALFEVFRDIDGERIFVVLSCPYKNDQFLAPSFWQMIPIGEPESR